MYTWQNPIGKREFVWSFGGKTFSDELVKVCWQLFIILTRYEYD
jgi:hypothetical protein